MWNSMEVPVFLRSVTSAANVAAEIRFGAERRIGFAPGESVDGTRARLRSRTRLSGIMSLPNGGPTGRAVPFGGNENGRSIRRAPQGAVEGQARSTTFPARLRPTRQLRNLG